MTTAGLNHFTTRALLAALALVANAPAAADDAQWLGGTGSWTDSNWSIPGIPNNNGTTFDVFIEGSSNVTLNSQSIDIDGLNLGSGSGLQINTFSLTINQDSTVDGLLTVSDAELFFVGQRIVEGTGTIYLNGSGSFTQFANLSAGSADAQLTLGPGITLLADGASSGGVVQLDLVNQGHVQVLNQADLRFRGITVDNTSGRISVDTPPGEIFGSPFGVVTMQNTHLIGGILDGGSAAPGSGGLIIANEGAIFEDVATIANNIDVLAASLILHGSTQLDGRVLLQNNQFFADHILAIDGPVALTGSGSILFESSSGNRIDPFNNATADVLTLAAGHTLGVTNGVGEGQIRASVDNHGLITSNGLVQFISGNVTNHGTMQATGGGSIEFTGATLINQGGTLAADADSTLELALLDLRDGSQLTGAGRADFIAGTVIDVSGDVAIDIATLELKNNTFGGFSHTIRASGTTTLSGEVDLNLTGQGLSIDPTDTSPASTDALVLGPGVTLTNNSNTSGPIAVNLPLTTGGGIVVNQGTFQNNQVLTNPATIRAEGTSQLIFAADVLGPGTIQNNSTAPLIFSEITPPPAPLVQGDSGFAQLLDEPDSQQIIENRVVTNHVVIQSTNAIFQNTIESSGEITIEQAAAARFAYDIQGDRLRASGLVQVEAGAEFSVIEVAPNGVLDARADIDHAGSTSLRGTLRGSAGTRVTLRGPVTGDFALIDGVLVDLNGPAEFSNQLIIRNGELTQRYPGSPSPPLAPDLQIIDSVHNYDARDRQPGTPEPVLAQQPSLLLDGGTASYREVRPIFNQVVVRGDSTIRYDGVERIATPINNLDVEDSASFTVLGQDIAYDRADLGAGSTLRGGSDLLQPTKLFAYDATDRLTRTGGGTAFNVVYDSIGNQVSNHADPNPALDDPTEFFRSDRPQHQAYSYDSAYRSLRDTEEQNDAYVAEHYTGEPRTRESVYVDPASRVVTRHGFDSRNLGSDPVIRRVEGNFDVLGNSHPTLPSLPTSQRYEGPHTFDLANGGRYLVFSDGDIFIGGIGLVTWQNGEFRVVASNDGSSNRFEIGAGIDPGFVNMTLVGEPGTQTIINHRRPISNSSLELFRGSSKAFNFTGEDGDRVVANGLSATVTDGQVSFSWTGGTNATRTAGIDGTFDVASVVNTIIHVTEKATGLKLDFSNYRIGIGSSPGTATVSGDVRFTDLIIDIEIGGLAAGTEYDQLLAEGLFETENLALNLTLIDGFESTIDAADVFSLIDSDTGIDVTFTNGLTSGGRLATADGLGSFQVFYGDGSAFGSDNLIVTNYQPVPEPGIGTLFTLAGIGLLGRRRRI